VADILSVEVGDKFGSIGTATTLEVIKIWFGFSVADNRWETSVTWVSRHPLNGDCQLSAKARDFVKELQDGCFTIVSKTAEGPSNGETMPLPSNDKLRRQWEDDFRRNAASYGLSTADLGRVVRLGQDLSKHYRIIGAKPQNWKMPILVQGKRGGVYKISAKKAKAGLV
jgi:hypothetical protein